MDLAQYDKWVIGNQKRILDWTKMHSKERYAPIRDAFSAYHRAKSNKQKIQAFENLKKELVSSKGVKFNDLVDNTFKPTIEYLQVLQISSQKATLMHWIAIVTFLKSLKYMTT